METFSGFTDVGISSGQDKYISLTVCQEEAGLKVCRPKHLIKGIMNVWQISSPYTSDWRVESV